MSDQLSSYEQFRLLHGSAVGQHSTHSNDLQNQSAHFSARSYDDDKHLKQPRSQPIDYNLSDHKASMIDTLRADFKNSQERRKGLQLRNRELVADKMGLMDANIKLIQTNERLNNEITVLNQKRETQKQKYATLFAKYEQLVQRTRKDKSKLLTIANEAKNNLNNCDEKPTDNHMC